ncbi:DUF1573 domain-containing protein [Gemmata algarum]|uniref:DUF1573 domain-containing protein n=1 Tax=Gemmata algarum TaxID=2975278 RepID=UPI0039C912FA
MRIVAALVLCGAGALAGCDSHTRYSPPPVGDQVTINRSTNLGRVSVGSAAVARFDLTNGGATDLIVLGGQGCCKVEGCAELAGEFPLTLAPGQTCTLKVACTFKRCGHFVGKIVLYTNSAQDKVVELSVLAEVAE